MGNICHSQSRIEEPAELQIGIRKPSANLDQNEISPLDSLVNSLEIKDNPPPPPTMLHNCLIRGEDPGLYYKKDDSEAELS